MADHPVPSPRELVRAYRTVRRLHSALFHEGEMGVLWERLVEGELNIARATNYLGYDRPEYQAAWERMLLRRKSETHRSPAR